MRPTVVPVASDHGRLSIWFHHSVYDPSVDAVVSGYAEGPDGKAAPAAPVPVSVADTSAVTDALASSGRLDFEIYPENKKARKALQRVQALYLVVGPEYPADRASEADYWKDLRVTENHKNRSTRCLLLQQRIEHGRPVWRVRPADAKNFYAQFWRQAEVYLLLATGKSLPVKHAEGRPVQWKLRIDYSGDWLRQTYRGVLRDLLALTLPTFEETTAFTSQTRIDSLLDDGLDVPALLSAYAVAEEVGRVADHVRDAARQPRPRLDLHVVHESLTPRAAVERWSAIPFPQPVTVLDAVRVMGQVLPTRFLRVDHPPADLDARIVAASAQVAGQVARRTLTLLENPVRAGLFALPPVGAAAAFVDAPRRRLHSHLTTLTRSLSVIGAPRSGGSSSEMLRQVRSTSPPVERLRRSALQLLDLRVKSGADHAVDAAWEPTNKVYERWCSLRLLDALVAIGFAPDEPFPPHSMRTPVLVLADAAGRPGGLRLTHPRLHGHLQVRFEPRYPFASKMPAEVFGAEDRYSHGRSSTPKGKNNPDIALEHWRPDARLPSIITLDPTTSRVQSRLHDKYAYYHTLRAFGTRGPAGESRRIVAASWALYPGIEGGPIYTEEMPDAPGTQRWRWGQFSLNARPESLQALAPWLEKLLVGTGTLRRAPRTSPPGDL